MLASAGFKEATSFPRLANAVWIPLLNVDEAMNMASRAKNPRIRPFVNVDMKVLSGRQIFFKKVYGVAGGVSFNGAILTLTHPLVLAPLAIDLKSKNSATIAGKPAENSFGVSAGTEISTFIFVI